MKARFSFALLAVLAGIAYALALDAGFVADDYPDLAYIANASFSDLLSDGLWGVRGGAGRYRPLLHVSAKLDWWIWGTDPLGYHVTHVVLHAASSMLLYSTMRRVASPFVAVVSAALWVVHPLHPEAVSWFAARGNLLAVFFSLLALELFVRERQDTTKRCPGRIAGAWCAALAAHLSHETVLLLPIVFASVDGLVLHGDASVARRVGAALQSFGFFVSALAVTVVLRLWILEEALGGEILSVLEQVPEGDRLRLVAVSLFERLRLVLAPAHPQVVGGTERWAVFAGTAALLAISLWLGRSRMRLGVIAALALAVGAMYAPSAFVSIGADRFVNTRMFYTILVPVAVCIAAVLGYLPAIARWGLAVVLVAGYLATTVETNRIWRRSANYATSWARATQEVAKRQSEVERIYLIDPPLVRDGMLVLENAIGSFLVPPFYPERRECHFLTNEMLTALAAVPERDAMTGPKVRYLWWGDRQFVDAQLPQKAGDRLPRTWQGNDYEGAPMRTLNVAAIEANATGILVLEWTSADGAKGEIPGWPCLARSSVIFPVAAHREWILAGTVTGLQIRGGGVGRVEALAQLPEISSLEPAPELRLARGAAPPRFAATGAGIGAVARLRFLTWPGPLSLPVPIAQNELAGKVIEVVPDLTPSTSGRFAWSVFEDAFLFAPGLASLYWCFEEVDVLGRPVARSALRRLVPVHAR